jgi:hypothetical protein
MSRVLAKRIAGSTAGVLLAATALVLSPGALTEANGSRGSAQPQVSQAPAFVAAPTYAPGASTPLVDPVPTEPSTAPRVLADVNAVTGVGSRFPTDSVTEPTVAVSPFDPNLVALVYQRVTGSSTCGLDTGIRISRDGGRTWQSATGRPWTGARRGPNYHGVIAWGPGPTQGSSRLWWADTTVPACDWTSHSLSISYSDDLGHTWAPLYVERRTPPWIGGFPDISVDTNPGSPNFGVAYVAYNWLADSRKGPGLAVLASADGGATWQMTQVPTVGLSGYPAAWRIGYRIRTAPDGSAYVAFYEADMRVWRSSDPFASLGLSNVGRAGFAVAHLHYDRTSRTVAADPATWAVTLSHDVYTVVGAAAPGTSGLLSPTPRWQMGLDVDPASGQVLLAVSDYATARTGRARGTIHVGFSSDYATTWQWRILAPLPQVDGRYQSPIRPTLAVRDGIVFVGLHGLTDIPSGSHDHATVGTFWAVSHDGGDSFSAPMPISSARWDPDELSRNDNGVGLRERADFGPDGIVRFAYGDGRLAARYPDRSAVFVALIDPGTR